VLFEEGEKTRSVGSEIASEIASKSQCQLGGIDDSTLVELASIGEGDSDFKFLHRGRMMPSSLSMSSWVWNKMQ
jgi:hypothetical protein